MPRPATAACAVLVCLLLGAGPARAAGEPDSPWVWPLAGTPRVARGFDPPPLRWAAGHRGVDLLARDGAIVRAAGAGSVTFAGLLAGRGVVVVTHGDGTRTTYQPVVATVARGEQVRAGDALGRLTASGHCLPLACLHWGRRRGDVYLDPMLVLRRGPARLLPVGAAPSAVPRSAGLDRSPARPMPAGRSTLSAARRSAGPWRLVSGAAAGLPVLATGSLLVALALRRGRLRAGRAARPPAACSRRGGCRRAPRPG